jgi:(4S)-4-hydroxy-5-phosphonooxypentane-2,3-dione isomerase
MIISVIEVHVKPEFAEAFEAATLENARNSVQEPGIAQFDCLRQFDDPNRLLFIEVYRSPEAVVQHKETAHYKIWRDTVAPMMAEPRRPTKYSNVFPADADW